MVDDKRIAVAWMLVSAVGFALMGATVRLSGDLPLPEKVFFRNLVTLAITGAIVLRAHESPFRGQPALGLLTMRSLAGLAGVFGYFYSIRHLHLADAAMLNKTSPFFVTVFATLLLREKLRRGTLPILLGAFAGAMLIIKPRLDLSVLPAVAGAASGLFAGLAYTLVRAMKGRASPHMIIFHFSLVSTLVAGCMLPGGWRTPDPGRLLALIGTGVFAAWGQFALTWAYHRAPAAEISIYSYWHILFSALLGLAIWGERPGLLSVAGGLLIVGVAWIDHRRGS